MNDIRIDYVSPAYLSEKVGNAVPGNSKYFNFYTKDLKLNEKLLKYYWALVVFTK